MQLTLEQLEPRLALAGTLHELQVAGASRDDVLHCLLEGCPLIPAAPLPHSDNLEMQAEHLYLFSLFQASEGDGVSKIVVPRGETLVVDECLAAEWIRVQGTLDIRDGAVVRVDTIVTDPSSTLTVTGGRVTFIDGALRSDDPLQMSRGLIAHGTVAIHGTAKTPFAETADLHAGDSVFTLTGADSVAGWNVGDRLVIPGTSQYVNEDDERTIAAIDGTTITLDRPLSFDHPELLGHKPVVANLTRSVVFESENPLGTRGHVMMMHNASRVSIEYAAFENLGRTRADVVVTDPALDGSGGGNPRGRYSLHFHRGGSGSNPGHVAGVIVSGARKLGIVNHSSHVIVDQSIVYRFDGSGFFTETGNELGAFTNNLAIRTTRIGGSATQESQLGSRVRATDFGHSGVGFWLQSPAVEMHGNASYGTNTGVGIFPGFPLVENGQSVTLSRDSLPVADPSVPETVQPWQFPFTLTDHVVVGSEFGIFTHHRGAPGVPFGRFNLIEDVDLIGVTYGIQFSYTAGVNVNNVRAVGNVEAAAGWAFSGNAGEEAIYYTDVSAEGFLVGFRPPTIGGFDHDHLDFSVERATLRTIVGIHFLPQQYEMSYRFDQLTFLPLPLAALIGSGYHDGPANFPAGLQVEAWSEP